MNALDRILVESGAPRPRPTFTADVMAAVRLQASAPAPLTFPWRRVAGGGVLVAASLVAAIGASGGAAQVSWTVDATWLWGLVVVLGSALAALVSVDLAEG